MFTSILIATYNRSSFIGQAIRSALVQSVDDIEVVVVDDGSTDDTAAIVSSIEDSRIRYIRCKHLGVGAARNLAVLEAQGEFTLVLDSDDYLLPGTLEAYAAAVQQHPDAEIIYGDLKLVDADGAECGERRFHAYAAKDFPRAMLRGCAIPHPGCLIRRDVYDRIGGYDESLSAKVDYDFFSRAVESCKCVHVNQFVCAYRQHGQHLSSPVNDRHRDVELLVMERIVNRYGIARLFPELLDAEAERSGRLQVAIEFMERGGVNKGLEYAVPVWGYGGACVRGSGDKTTYLKACGDYLCTVRKKAPASYRREALRAFRTLPSMKTLTHLVAGLFLRNRVMEW